MKYIYILYICLFSYCSKSKENPHFNYPLNRAKIYIRLAQQSNLSYNQRVLYNKKALQILKNRKNDSLNREDLITVSKIFYHLNQWKELKATAQFVNYKSKEKCNIYHVGLSYRWIGIYFENISRNDSAFYYYLKAEKIFKKINKQKNLCDIYQDKAQVQYYANDYLGNELSLIKAFKIAKKLGLNYQQYRIYLNLGVTSGDLKDYEKSFEYYNKALVIGKKYRKEFSKRSVIAFCLNNIGLNYFYSGNLKKAILIYNEALKEENLNLKEPIIFCRLLDNLAYSKCRLKEFDSVSFLYFKAAKIRDSLNIDSGKNYNKLYLSEYYMTIHDTLKAKQFAQEAFDLSKNFKAPNDMLLCLKQLSKVEPENALKYTTDYIRISDSMQQLERETRNKFAKIAYETEEITNEKEAAIHQKWIFFGLAVILFIVAILLFIVITQRTRQKEMLFLQEQQKNNDEIYQLIQSQQTKIDEGRHIEKKRIAQDLHDGIMNKLTSTRLNLHILNKKRDAETIKKCLPFIDEIQNIEKEIRNIAHDLNKDVFSKTDSFIAVVNSLLEEQKMISKTKCHLEIDKTINWDLIEGAKKIHIYRILQEAFRNSNKHAGADNIVASILNCENHILIEIYDDGIGFSLNEKKKGIGLQNIFSRAKNCNGSAEIKSKKGEGTTLIVKIPIKANLKTA